MPNITLLVCYLKKNLLKDIFVNYNPHMNRGYLWLIVPNGDVAIKICHYKLY